MQYRVQPKEYHRGYCPTICDTMASAEEELALMRKHTDFEWEIIEESDEDDGTIMDDEDDEDPAGEPEYVLEHGDQVQVYTLYAKALDGYRLYRSHYTGKGWDVLRECVSKRDVVVDGVAVRARCAVLGRGRERYWLRLYVRMDCQF